jgi:hypothetical protein
VFIEIGEHLPQFRNFAHILSHLLTTTRNTRDRWLRGSEALRGQPSPGIAKHLMIPVSGDTLVRAARRKSIS